MNADLAFLILRVVIGLTFFAHGAQKVLGWWDGPGPKGWKAAIERMGFRPRELWAFLSAGAEFIGGPLLAMGFLTPFATAALLGQSVVIIAKVHAPKGFWNTQGGYEFPLSLAAAILAVAVAGPGAYSVDASFGLAFSDLIRLSLIALGLLGGLGAFAVPRLTAANGTAAPTR